MKPVASLFRGGIGAAILLLSAGMVHAGDWERAMTPRAWSFPRDHGAHFEYKTEWWYFTGNLAGKDGRRFGYQLTFFRQGLTPNLKLTQSAWGVRDIYFAHLTITDVAAGRFHFEERTGRGSRNMAGASVEKMDVWIGDWKLETAGPDAYRLSAAADGLSLDLTLKAGKPLVLQGERGLSQKAEAPGNASNYYSYPRLETGGTLGIGRETYGVEGVSWFDHEFSTSSLGPDQVGWDWFSIQLNDGEELMLYQMRKKDGTTDSFSSGTWVDRNGVARHLAAGDYRIERTGTWKSGKTGAIYPSGWKIVIPKLEIELQVEPQVKDQELVLEQIGRLSYWEGSCRVGGKDRGGAVEGWGYTELTGYEKPVGGELR
jgi:predicted secreted hydrolase